MLVFLVILNMYSSLLSISISFYPVFPIVNTPSIIHMIQDRFTTRRQRFPHCILFRIMSHFQVHQFLIIVILLPLLELHLCIFLVSRLVNLITCSLQSLNHRISLPLLLLLIVTLQRALQSIIVIPGNHVK